MQLVIFSTLTLTCHISSLRMYLHYRLAVTDHVITDHVDTVIPSPLPRLSAVRAHGPGESRTPA